jgi:hypothetical protein
MTYPEHANENINTILNNFIYLSSVMLFCVVE